MLGCYTGIIYDSLLDKKGKCERDSDSSGYGVCGIVARDETMPKRLIVAISAAIVTISGSAYLLSPANVQAATASAGLCDQSCHSNSDCSADPLCSKCSANPKSPANGSCGGT